MYRLTGYISNVMGHIHLENKTQLFLETLPKKDKMHCTIKIKNSYLLEKIPKDLGNFRQIKYYFFFFNHQISENSVLTFRVYRRMEKKNSDICLLG